MYLGISLALLWGCGVLGGRLFGLEGTLERFLGGALLSLAALVLLSLGIGLIPGGYRPLPLTLGAAALFLLLLAAAWRTGRMATAPTDSEERPYLLALVAAAAVTLPVWLWILYGGLLLPPVYWDELYYHLVAPAIWARSGQIHSFATGNPFVAGYPANFGLVPGWSMVMTGTDVWADLAGLPFVFLGMGAVAAFCRRLGVRPWNAFWAVLLFAATPLVIFHAKAAYIDLPMAAVFAVALYWLGRFATGGERCHLLLGAAAMGLLVGAKYSGPYLAIAGVLPLVYYMRTAHIRRISWRQLLLWYALPILLLGAFWYGRNLVLFHNPLYPMRLRVAGITIFAGRYDADAFTFTKPENGWVTLGKALLELDPHPVMDSFYAGFGPQVLLLAIPAAAAFLWRDRERRGPVAMAWLLPLLASIAVLPARYPRYLIAISILLLPFAAWLLDRMNRGSAGVVKTVAAGFAAYSVIIGTPLYSVSPNAYDVAASSVWTTSDLGFGSQYGLIQELNAKKGGPLRIATGPLRLTYPLLGEHWQNELLYTAPSTEQAWLAGVLAGHPDLFWWDHAWDDAVEAPWVEQHPEIFRLIGQDTAVNVYVVVPGDAAHQRFVQRLGVQEVQR